MIEIRGHRDGELAWIEERTKAVLTRDARAVVAEEDGQIVGMVAFDAWTENAAQAHMAVVHPGVWLRLLRPGFHYVFEQAKKGILVGVIPSHNEASVRFSMGLGFKPIARIRDGWAPNDDMVMLEMRRETCRFLGRS